MHRTIIVRITLAAITLSILGHANATLVRGTFTGSIYNSWDQYGSLGPAGYDHQMGLTVNGEFQYDTELAPVSACVEPNAGCYYPGALTWLGNANIEIDGIASLPVVANNGATVRVYDEVQAGEDHFWVEVSDQFWWETDDRLFWQQVGIYLRLSERSDIIQGIALPTSLAWSPGGNTLEATGDYFLSEEIIDQTTGTILSARSFGGYFHLDNVTLTAVPLPAAAWLFLAGIVALLGSNIGPNARNFTHRSG